MYKDVKLRYDRYFTWHDVTMKLPELFYCTTWWK